MTNEVFVSKNKKYNDYDGNITDEEKGFLEDVCKQEAGAGAVNLLMEYRELASAPEYYSYFNSDERASSPKEVHKSIYHIVKIIKKRFRAVWLKSYFISSYKDRRKRQLRRVWKLWLPYYKDVIIHWGLFEARKINHKKKTIHGIRCEGVALFKTADLFKLLKNVVPVIDSESLREDLAYLEELSLSPCEIELWPAYQERQECLKISFSFDRYPLPDPCVFFSNYLEGFAPKMIERLQYLDNTMSDLYSKRMNRVVLEFDLGTGAIGYGFKFCQQGWSTNQTLQRKLVRNMKQKRKHFTETRTY